MTIKYKYHKIVFEAVTETRYYINILDCHNESVSYINRAYTSKNKAISAAKREIDALLS